MAGGFSCRTVSHRVAPCRNRDPKAAGQGLHVSDGRGWVAQRESQTQPDAPRADTNHTGRAMSTTTDGYLTYRAAADYLGLSRKTLERAVAASRIPYVRDPLTGRVRFRQSELDTWMAGRDKRGRRRSS